MYLVSTAVCRFHYSCLSYMYYILYLLLFLLLLLKLMLMFVKIIIFAVIIAIVFAIIFIYHVLIFPRLRLHASQSYYY